MDPYPKEMMLNQVYGSLHFAILTISRQRDVYPKFHGFTGKRSLSSQMDLRRLVRTSYPLLLYQSRNGGPYRGGLTAPKEDRQPPNYVRIFKLWSTNPTKRLIKNGEELSQKRWVSVQTLLHMIALLFSMRDEASFLDKGFSIFPEVYHILQTL